MKVHIVVADVEDLEEIVCMAERMEKEFHCECAVTVSMKKDPKKAE